MSKMLQIPVKDISYQEQLMRWLSIVHTNSRIDFTFDTTTKRNTGLILINAHGSRLEIDGYDNQIDEMFEIIEPTWYVGDIRLKESIDQKIFYYVEMEIHGVPVKFDSTSNRYNPTKWFIEDDLSNLYLNKFSEDIRIPLYRDGVIIEEDDRKRDLAKMIISLKGICIFKEIDHLAILKELLIREKYPEYYNNRLNYAHPLEIMELIEDVHYQFPSELGWADVIKMMGEFSHSNSDDERVISLCKGNMEKVCRYLYEDSDFAKQIVNPIQVIIGAKDKKKSKDKVLTSLLDMMIKIVVAHELGHMVFRRIEIWISIPEKETLANWFSSLVLDDLYQNMIKQITVHQSEEYRDYIELPQKHTLKNTKYQAYCDKINSMLWSW